MTLASSASLLLSPSPIAWGVSSRAFGAAAETGDLHVVVPCAQTVLVAAIDGLATVTKPRWPHEPQPPFWNGTATNRWSN